MGHHYWFSQVQTQELSPCSPKGFLHQKVIQTVTQLQVSPPHYIRFLWPTIYWHHNNSNKLPASLLQPIMLSNIIKFIKCLNLSDSQNPKLANPLKQQLTVPRCLWSQITIDFIIDLPVAQGHTTILTVIVKSQACWFILNFQSFRAAFFSQRGKMAGAQATKAQPNPPAAPPANSLHVPAIMPASQPCCWRTISTAHFQVSFQPFSMSLISH